MQSAHPSFLVPRLAALAFLCAPALAQSAVKSAAVLPARSDVKSPAAPLQKLERPLQHAAAPAQASKSKPPAKGERTALDHSSVLYRELPDALWARGQSYKASFGAQGMTYVPFLGSQAPRDFPVAFALQSVKAGGVPLALGTPAAAARQGDVLTLDRGLLSEVYRLAPESVEQFLGGVGY